MESNNVFQKLHKLNNAQRGSLGEFLFQQECISIGKRIKPLHEKRADFLLDDTEKIDVKTSFSNIKKLNKQIPVSSYNGPRYSGITYALVE